MANMTKHAYDNRIETTLPPMLMKEHQLEEKRVSQQSAPANQADGWENIETRFGSVAFHTAQPIVFAKGLLGMPDKVHFGLANFPSEKFSQFQLFQSFDDHQLSFITMPLGISNTLIQEEDIRRACDDLGMHVDDVAMLLIVTVHRSPNGVKLSVNLRAPLMVDAKRRQGMQYVFSHDRYGVQHFLAPNAG